MRSEIGERGREEVYWNRYCFNIVIAVVTRGGRPVDNEWRVMLEEIMFVVLQHNWQVKVSGRRNRE